VTSTEAAAVIVADDVSRRFGGPTGARPEHPRAGGPDTGTNIMEEHARFIAHLLDPDEFELIEKAMSASNIFRSLGGDSVGGTVAALAAEHGAVLESLANRPEVNAVMSAVQSILDFKTQAVRDIEAGRIKSIIEPRLADHVRREALKFLNELKRSPVPA